MRTGAFLRPYARLTDGARDRAAKFRRALRGKRGFERPTLRAGAAESAGVSRAFGFCVGKLLDV